MTRAVVFPLLLSLSLLPSSFAEEGASSLPASQPASTPARLPVSLPTSAPALPKKPPMVVEPAVCGNGYLEITEECDDSNTDLGDGCRADCTLERCGDQRFDVGESCEDCPADCAFLPEPLPEFPPKRRSPGVALSISLTGTLASYGALTSGIILAAKQRPAGAPLIFFGSLGAIFAPGMGHLYAGEGPYAAKSAVIRFVSAGVAGGSFALALLTDGDIEELIGLGILGLVGLFGSTALDIVDSPAAARRAREGRSNPKQGPFALLPAPLSSPTGAKGVGLFALGRF